MKSQQQTYQRFDTDTQQVQYEYIIWPCTDMSPQEVAEAEGAIRSTVGPKVTLDKFVSPFDGLRFWYAYITEDQAEELKQLDQISEIEKNRVREDLVVD